MNLVYYTIICLVVCIKFSNSFQTFRLSPHFHRRSILEALNTNIATYNVLSSKLSDQSSLPHAKEEHLLAPKRFLLLKKKLQTEIDKRSIICLQEVSNDWAGELHTFFSKQGYHILTGLYGNRANGYMGVAIAIPLDKYDVVEIDIKKIGDSKRATVPSRVESKGFWNGAVSRITKTLEAAKNIWGGEGYVETENSFWDWVKKRENQMICVRLQSKMDPAESFVVGTYHMPCAYTNPELMVAHCALSVQHIERFSRGMAFVYAGDFNFRPFTTMYSMMTQGHLDSTVSFCAIFTQLFIYFSTLIIPICPRVTIGDPYLNGL